MTTPARAVHATGILVALPIALLAWGVIALPFILLS